MTHTLDHALRGCGCRCDMTDINVCVICEKRLPEERRHVDTCGPCCQRRLLALQRKVEVSC